MAPKIVKWKFSKVDKTPQNNVSHIDIEGSDVSGIVVYRTDNNTYAILKSKSIKMGEKWVDGAGFTYMDQLLGFLPPRTHAFKARTRNGSIENAMRDGRHVYSFESVKHFLANKQNMLKPSKRLTKQDFYK